MSGMHQDPQKRGPNNQRKLIARRAQERVLLLLSTVCCHGCRLLRDRNLYSHGPQTQATKQFASVEEYETSGFLLPCPDLDAGSK